MIGIYKLYWPECNYYYIGQSRNIEHRYKGHLSQMKRFMHSARKLQTNYNLYGFPRLMVLKNCKASELDHYEREFILLDYDEEFCCNVCNTVPIRNVLLKLTKEDYQVLSLMARATKHKSVVKYIITMINQRITEVKNVK